MELPKCKELRKYVLNLIHSKVAVKTERTANGHIRVFLSNGRFVIVPSNKGEEGTIKNVKSHVRKEMSYVRQ